jgi:hypothetical protein
LFFIYFAAKCLLCFSQNAIFLCEISPNGLVHDFVLNFPKKFHLLFINALQLFLCDAL